LGDGKFSAQPDAFAETKVIPDINDYADKPSFWATAQALASADDSDISPWALDAVGQIRANGIMGGVGGNMFAPKDSYTREQSITTMLLIYERIIQERP